MKLKVTAVVLVMGLATLYGCFQKTSLGPGGSAINEAAFTDGTPWFPIDVVRMDDGRFLLATHTQNALKVYDSAFSEAEFAIAFDAPPTGVATAGDMAYVTTFDKTGQVHVVDLRRGRIDATIPTGSGAHAPVLNSDGTVLYVLNQFQNTVSRIDLAAGTVTGTVEVTREPSSAVLSACGGRLFVGNLLPAGRADVDHVTSVVSVIDTDGWNVVREVPLTNGSNALRGMSLSPDGEWVLVTHTIARFGLPTNQLLQGWMNNSAMSVLDAQNGDLLGSVLLDSPEHGAGGLWGIGVSDDLVVVAHSGTHEISVIDYAAFRERLLSYSDLSLLNFDLRFLTGIRHRVPLHGNGPRNLVVDGPQAWVPTFFSDHVNHVDLQDALVPDRDEWAGAVAAVPRHAGRIRSSVNPSGIHVHSVLLNEHRHESPVHAGERIFNDATFCFQNWQSCASCHPGEARVDGLNWDLLNDGVGNPKNTKSLLYSHETPPAMISGIRERAEIAVRAGFTHIQFTQISEQKAGYVDEYLMSLRPVPSPWLENGSLSERAQSGRTVFENLGCANCHSGAYYTDMKMHRIGEDVEFERGWDTPSLVEIWRTAPYLFDGRAATLEEVFSVHRHGIEREISESDLERLVAYLKSL